VPAGLTFALVADTVEKTGAVMRKALKETLNKLLRGRIAALRGARFLADLLDRLWSLRAARQLLHPARRFSALT